MTNPLSGPNHSESFIRREQCSIYQVVCNRIHVKFWEQWSIFLSPKVFPKATKEIHKKKFFRKSSHIWGPLPTKQLQPPFYVWVLINLYICSLCELTGFALMLSRLLTVGYFFAQKLWSSCSCNGVIGHFVFLS